MSPGRKPAEELAKGPGRKGIAEPEMKNQVGWRRANRRGPGAGSVGKGAGLGGDACVVGISPPAGEEGAEFGDTRGKVNVCSVLEEP